MKPHYLPILLVLLVALAVPLCAVSVGDAGSGEKTFRIVSQTGFEQQFDYSFEKINSSDSYWTIKWAWKNPALRTQIVACISPLNLTCLYWLGQQYGGNSTILSGLGASPLLNQTQHIRPITAGSTLGLLTANNGSFTAYLTDGWRTGERIKIGYASTIVETTVGSAATRYAEQRKLLYVPECSAVVAAYTYGGQAYARISTNNGTTWGAAQNVSKGGSLDISLSAAFIPQTKDIWMAFADFDADKIYFVNFSYSSCAWTKGATFNATDVAVVASTYGYREQSLAACPDGSLHLFFNGAIGAKQPLHKVCRAGAGSNCSIAANWNASDNSAGYDLIFADSAAQRNAFCDMDSNAYSIANDANTQEGKLVKFQKTGAGTWLLEYVSTAPIGSTGYDESWSATTNSSGAIFVVRGKEQLAGENRRAQGRYCDGGLNCSVLATWKDLGGFASWQYLIPPFSAISNVTTQPSISIVNDTPQIAVETQIYDANYDVVVLGINSSGTGWNMTANYSRDALGNRYPQAPENSTRMMAIWTNGTSPYSVVFNITSLAAAAPPASGGGLLSQVAAYNNTWNYELNGSFYNATFNNTNTSNTIIYCNFSYGGTQNQTLTLTESGGGNYTYSFTFTHPLAPANNTAYTSYYQCVGNYSNGTVWNWASPTFTQNIMYSIYPAAFSLKPALAISGTTTTATLNVTQLFAPSSATTAFAELNATNTTLSADGLNWTGTLVVPTITNATNILSAFGYLNVTNGTTSYLRPSPAATLTIYRLSVCACAVACNQTIANFTARDEETNATVNFTMDATFWLWNAGRTINTTFSGNWTNVTYAEICIFPNWATGSLDSFQTYYSTVNGTSQRGKFIWNVSVSNSTTLNYTLFSLPSSVTNQTIIYVQDSSGLKVESAIVKILRYFPATNEYVNVAETITDFDGRGTTYLRVPDVFYRFVVEKNGVTELYSSPSIITCSNNPYCPPYSVTLITNPAVVAGFWTVTQNVAVNCSFNNATNILICLIADPQSTLSSANMLVTETTGMNESIVCNTTVSAFPAAIPCLLGGAANNVTGHLYWLYLWGISASDQSLVLLDPTPLDFRALLFNWGLTGIVAAFMVVITMYFLGSFNPSVAIVAAYIGLVACWMLNLITLRDVGDGNGLVDIIGMGVIVGLLVWKMRT